MLLLPAMFPTVTNSTWSAFCTVPSRTELSGSDPLSVTVPAQARVSDSMLAETMIGKAVEHMFETEEGPKEEWRGMVLARAPIMTSWFYITYEKDPVLYMYQLLDDYKEGDLRILPDCSECLSRPCSVQGAVLRPVRATITQRFLCLCPQTTIWRQSGNLARWWTVWWGSRWSTPKRVAGSGREW